MIDITHAISIAQIFIAGGGAILSAFDFRDAWFDIGVARGVPSPPQDVRAQDRREAHAAGQLVTCSTILLAQISLAIAAGIILLDDRVGTVIAVHPGRSVLEVIVSIALTIDSFSRRAVRRRIRFLWREGRQ